MPEPKLVSIEFRFVTGDDPSGLAERIREAAKMIVAPSKIEDFRVHSMPTTPPKNHLRPV